MRTRTLTTRAIVAASLIGSAASAQTLPRPRYRLEYLTNAPASRCPDASAFTERVGDFLGEREPFVTTSPRTIRVELSVQGRQLRGSYTVLREGEAASQPRSFVASTCGLVVDDLARSVGLVLDPLALMRASRTPPTPVSTAGVEVIPDTHPHERPPPIALDDRPAAAPPARRRAVVVLDAGAGVSFGATATVAPSVQLGASVRWTRFTLGFEARADLPVTQDVSQVAGARYTSALVGGAVVPCAAWSVVSVCGLVGAGAVLRDATGVPRATSSAELSVWAGARAGATWTLGSRLALMAFAELAAPVVQAVPVLRVSADATVPVWDAPPVQASVGIRALVRLR